VEDEKEKRSKAIPVMVRTHRQSRGAAQCGSGQDGAVSSECTAHITQRGVVHNWQYGTVKSNSYGSSL
jgi:hypothetical protein